MNYTKHYFALIERSRQRKKDGYLEKHHIVPKCMGGTDEKSNLVLLTPEEHYVAHLLLVKIYDTPSLIHAALMMTVSSSQHNVGKGRNNKLYGWLRRKYQIVAKQKVREKNGSFGKPWYHDPSTLNSGKYIPGLEPIGWVKGRKPKKVNICQKCGTSTETILQFWCNSCRPKQKQSVFKSVKTKSEYSEDEKIKALIANHGNIRKALFSLGLNDSGTHYRKMKIIKASVYPLATNQVKG